MVDMHRGMYGHCMRAARRWQTVRRDSRPSSVSTSSALSGAGAWREAAGSAEGRRPLLLAAAALRISICSSKLLELGLLHGSCMRICRQENAFQLMSFPVGEHACIAN